MATVHAVEGDFLYEEIASQVATLINDATLKPGERIPSVRQMSAERGVSISTVLQAYRLLEDRGLIEARPQSGYYVRKRLQERVIVPECSQPPRSSTPVSVTSLILDVYERVNHPDYVPFGAAVPSPELLPTEELSRAMARVARREAADTMTYLLSQGSPKLREAIARRTLLWGGQFNRDDVIVTSGCTEALALGLRTVARPGDTIAIESPTYFGVLQLIDSLGMKALEFPTDPTSGVRLDELERVLKAGGVRACLFAPNFNNPLGSLMPDERKEALVEMLARYGIPLIEDDLYGDLYFGVSRPMPAKAFDKAGMVLYCGSFSKTISPGYRIGWIIPGRFLQDVKRLKYASTISSSSPAQYAIASYLEGSGYERHLRRLRGAVERGIAHATDAVCRYFPEGTRVTRPQGGFVLWVELPERVDAVQLFHEALRAHITIAPGPIFSASGSFTHFIRLNCGHPWSDRMEQALEQIGQIVYRMLRE